MGEKKAKKEKKEKKEKKAKKKEKKRKKQKVDHADDHSVQENDAIAQDHYANATKEEPIGGLPPGFYEATVNSEEKDDRQESAETTNEEDAHATNEGDEDNNTDAAAPPAKRKRKRKRKRKAETNDNDDDEEDAVESNALDDAALTQDTIFVEGIPFDVSPDDVRAFFVEIHGIPDSDVLELRLPKWQDTGRLRGFGHVKFASSEAYQKALGLHRKYMGKRYLSIQPAKSGTSGNRSGKSVEDPTIVCPEGCLTIYVNNLPYSATEEEIEAAFSKHTPQINIEGVRIARNSVTRQSKGFAYIDFETPDDTKRLMKHATKKNVSVGGRIVRLDYDTGRIKGSFRTESGRLLHKNHED